jgi:prepilin-type N-terminal cleavage/methylation domain-containing protein
MKMIQPQRRHSAFTLIEIMVALMIFGVTMAAVATVIHTSVRAWRVGHAVSEISQSAHVTQDVISRDLENLYYIPEQGYNKAFRRQMKTLAQQLEQQTAGSNTRHAQQRAATIMSNNPEGQFGLADITPPLDLSFRGGGAEGPAGELSFARLQPARWEGDPETGGVRRVKYYVKDNILYREETDPYGFRPGAAFAIEPEDEKLASLFSLTQLYMASDKNQPSAVENPEMADEARQAIPVRLNYAEPLCLGIEKFELAFGYFRDGLWQEVGDWDSGQVRYRHQVDPGEAAAMGQALTNEQRMGFAMGAANNPLNQVSNRQPDDLPGYIRITLSLVPAEAKGREHSFSFYYSIPQAQEDDVYNENRVADAGGDAREASRLDSELQRRDSRRSRRASHSSRPNRYNQGRGRNRGDSSSEFALGGNNAGEQSVAPGWGWQTETGY